MVRSVRIGRGDIGQARTPDRLPSAGAGLVGVAISEEARLTQQQFTAAQDQNAREEAAEDQKVEDAQSKGQLLHHAAFQKNLVASVGEAIATEDEETFRTRSGIEEFQFRIESLVDTSLLDQGRVNPLNDDAQLVVSNTEAAFREELFGEVDRSLRKNEVSVLRADSMEGAQLLVEGTSTFDQAEENFGEALSVYFTEDIFTSSREALALAEDIRERSYAEVLKSANDVDLVEGAALALELPDDLSAEFRVPIEDGAAKQLKRLANPDTGEWGLGVLEKVLVFSPSEVAELQEQPELIDEIFEDQIAELQAYRLHFLRHRELVTDVYGGDTSVVEAHDDNFVIIDELVQKRWDAIAMGYGFLTEEVVGAGPNDPTTVAASELFASIGGRVEALDRIRDENGQIDIPAYAQQFKEDVRRMTNFTRSYGQAIVADFQNFNDPTRQARAAFAYGELHRLGEEFLRGEGGDLVSDEDALKMLLVHQHIRDLKTEPARALEFVRERTREIDIQGRSRDFERKYQIPRAGDEDLVLKKLTGGPLFGGFTNNFNPADNTEELPIPSTMLREYRELAHLYFIETNGNDEAAFTYAYAQLRKAGWAVTDDGGNERRWAKGAPESMFPNQETSWLTPDLKEQYLEETGRRFPENATLIPFEDPTDPTKKSIFQVLEIGSDGFPRLATRRGHREDRPKIFHYVPNRQRSPSMRATKKHAVQRQQSRALNRGKSDLNNLRLQLNHALGKRAGSDDPDDLRFRESAKETIRLIDSALDAANKTEDQGFSETQKLELFMKRLAEFEHQMPFTEFSPALEKRGIRFEAWTASNELERRRDVLLREDFSLGGFEKRSRKKD